MHGWGERGALLASASGSSREPRGERNAGGVKKHDEDQKAHDNGSGISGRVWLEKVVEDN